MIRPTDVYIRRDKRGIFVAVHCKSIRFRPFRRCSAIFDDRRDARKRLREILNVAFPEQPEQ